MRNLKKLLAVIVAVCTILTFAVPAFAADATLSADTQACKTIGMLVGQDANGVTPAYEATNPTRIQAAVMLLRLKGALADAQAYTGTTNFVDADKANWAKPIMAYLKAHPEFGYQGIGGDKFDPTGLITAQQYYKVILTALGYTVKDSAGVGDYAYADTLTFAKDTAKLAVAGNVENFTIGNLATATVEVLKATVKGGTTTLAASLVAAGKLDKAAAVTAGVYNDVLSATAAQTGAKTLTVTFNRALTAAEKTAATFSVKNGLVAYTVTATWAADNASVVLAYQYNLYAGDYSIAIGGITDPVKATVADEKVSKIAIDDEYLPLQDNYNVAYKVYNQFNEEMADVTNLVFSAFDANKAKGVIDTAAPDFQVDLAANGAAKDDNVILTVTYKTGVTVSKTVPVKDVAAPKTLQFGSVAPLSGETRITKGDEGLTLPYTFTDQYGKAYKLPVTTKNADNDADKEMIGEVYFMSSDVAVVNPDTFAVDEDGVLTFDATGDGTAVISALVPATGTVATATIKIEADAAVKTFTMSNPGKLVAATETVTVPYTAVDTFGAPIAQKDFTKAIGDDTDEVNFVSSNDTIIDDSKIYFNGKHELLMPTENKAGTVTVYAKVGGVLQGSITIDVKAIAAPAKITGLKDVPTLFQDTTAGTAVGTIEMKNLNVIDQYNRPIDLGTYASGAAQANEVYTVDLTYDLANQLDGGDYVAIGATTIDKNNDSSLTDVAVGTEKIKFELKKDAAVISTYKTSVKTIANDDIKGYEFDTIPTLYGKSTNDGTVAHAKAVTLLGKDASGNKVTIDQDSIITAITSSNTAIVKYDAVNKKLYALKAGTATVAAWKGGTKIAEVTVTAKDEDPYAVKVTFDPTSQALSVGDPDVDLTATITIEDQYGVAIVDNGTWASSDPAVATATAGSLHAVAVGSATITYVTETGIVATGSYAT